MRGTNQRPLPAAAAILHCRRYATKPPVPTVSNPAPRHRKVVSFAAAERRQLANQHAYREFDERPVALPCHRHRRALDQPQRRCGTGSSAATGCAWDIAPEHADRLTAELHDSCAPRERREPGSLSALRATPFEIDEIDKQRVVHRTNACPPAQVDTRARGNQKDRHRSVADRRWAIRVQRPPLEANERCDASPPARVRREQTNQRTTLFSRDARWRAR